MSRKCELSGVSVQYGNKVSHSQRKTRRRFEPNMRVVRFLSETVSQEFRLRVNAHAMRTVEKLGGIDEYLLEVSHDVLSDNAKIIRKKIIDKRNKANQ